MVENAYQFGCRDCKIAAVKDRGEEPKEFAYHSHIGYFLFPICYEPQIPDEIRLETKTGKYTYKLVLDL